LQGSWSDHCNLKKKRKEKKKRHSSMVCESWWAPDGIGLPWFEKGKGGKECQAIKEHNYAN
jgi:hypothetical protein